MFLDRWHELVGAGDPVAGVCTHFEPLTDGERCREILAEFAEKVMSIAIASPPKHIDAGGAEQVLQLVLPWCEDGVVQEDEEPIDMWFYPPFEGAMAAAVPSGIGPIGRLHRRIVKLDRTSDIPWIWWGPDASGELVEAASHDRTFHRGGQDPDFVRGLAAAGLTIDQVQVPINAAEDWYLLNPAELARGGRPRWSFVSHESGVVGPDLRPDLSLAAVFLRLLLGEFVEHPDAALR